MAIDEGKLYESKQLQEAPKVVGFLVCAACRKTRPVHESAAFFIPKLFSPKCCGETMSYATELEQAR